MVYEIKCNDNVIYRIYASDEFIQYMLVSSTGTTLHDRKYYWEYENYCKHGTKIQLDQLGGYYALPAPQKISTVTYINIIAKKTSLSFRIQIGLSNGSTGIPITDNYNIIMLKFLKILEDKAQWIIDEPTKYNLHIENTGAIYTYGNATSEGTSNIATAIVPCYLFHSSGTDDFYIRGDFLNGLYSNNSLLDQTHLKFLTIEMDVVCY